MCRKCRWKPLTFLPPRGRARQNSPGPASRRVEVARGSDDDAVATVVRKLVAKRADRDPERLRRVRAVAAMVLKRLENHGLLDVVERASRLPALCAHREIDRFCRLRLH